jgi:hypothetical protein
MISGAIQRPSEALDLFSAIDSPVAGVVRSHPAFDS